MQAVRSALARHDGVVKRLARAAGIDKVAVGGVSFALDQVGLGDGVSLSAALAALSDESQRPIALVIDEAQHAITSDSELLRVVHSLTPLQSAVLRVLAARGHAYAPFEAGTVATYQAVLQATGQPADAKADVPGVQQALPALQAKSLVWRAARGVYALEEVALSELMAADGLLAVVPPVTAAGGAGGAVAGA